MSTPYQSPTLYRRYSQVLHDNIPENGSKTLYLDTNVENIKALIWKIELVGWLVYCITNKKMLRDWDVNTVAAV